MRRVTFVTKELATMSTDNLMLLAKAAAESNNQQEAYNYYMKVLEVDPTNADAWFGKAAAAGWLSTLANIRLQEMLVTIQTAISFVPDEQKALANMKAADLINKVAVALFQLAKKHFLEYPSFEAWNAGYTQHCNQVLIALEAAYNYTPYDKQIMINIITVASDYAQGTEFYDRIDRNLRTVIYPTPEIETTLKDAITLYTEKIRVFDPAYIPPAICKPTPPKYLVSESGGCFNVFAVTVFILIYVIVSVLL